MACCIIRDRPNISIHALLAESDIATLMPCAAIILFLSTLSLRRATLPGTAGQKCGQYFYPRSPCGERHVVHLLKHFPPAISIHALLAESDLRRNRHSTMPRKFLSTLSLRRATHHGQPAAGWRRNFYPRSPCGERRILLGFRCVG